MRLPVFLPFIAIPFAAAAQTRPLSSADSALVAAILSAEDRRDSTALALADGLRHEDPRVSVLARRALGRIRDPQFRSRDSLPPLSPPPAWPEPAWRLRYRALATLREDCGALRTALADSAWQVRLRAADLLAPPCGNDGVVINRLRDWVDALPANAARRRSGEVSWHAAAHAVVALARLSPVDAPARLQRLGAHAQWQVRLYAARAAAVLSDSASLRVLARDPDDNVKEAAIEALVKLTGHADDRLYLAALHANGAQAVRAAALGLKGSPEVFVRDSVNAAFERWVRRANASERDARVALLEAAGRPASDDHPPARDAESPPRAVALALGENVRLRVTMSDASGGGSFVVRLRGDVAPIMAARVLELVRAGYYDGGVWHRVEPDFVIQGAGPGTNEYVGYGSYFRDELGTVPHVRGTVGMSTRGHDTGDAQWFINLKDNLRLGRDYTVFAEVVDGIELVDQILEGDIVAHIRAARP